MPNNDQQEALAFAESLFTKGLLENERSTIKELVVNNWSFFKQFEEKNIKFDYEDKHSIRIRAKTLSNLLPYISHIPFDKKKWQSILENPIKIEAWVNKFFIPLKLNIENNLELLINNSYLSDQDTNHEKFSSFVKNLEGIGDKSLISKHWKFFVDLFIINPNIETAHLNVLKSFLETCSDDVEIDSRALSPLLQTYYNFQYDEQARNKIKSETKNKKLTPSKINELIKNQKTENKELIFDNLNFFLNLNKNKLLNENNLKLIFSKETPSSKTQSHFNDLKNFLLLLKKNEITIFDNFSNSEMEKLIKQPSYFFEKVKDLKKLNLVSENNIKTLLNPQKTFGTNEFNTLNEISEETDRVFDKIDSKKLSNVRKESFSNDIKKSYKKELLQTSFDYLVNDSQESSKNKLATKLTQQEQSFVKDSKLANDNSNSSQFKRNILSKLTKFSIAILTLGIVPLKNFLKNRQQSAPMDTPKASERSLSLFYRHDHTNSHNSIINLTNHTCRVLGAA
ncbi:hypothetical protein L3V86_05090 [Thiotrichales bacterium 19S11-10]|nr:hypothetical protein [Thiotrichales bacterium 19S11-10]